MGLTGILHSFFFNLKATLEPICILKLTYIRMDVFQMAASGNAKFLKNQDSEGQSSILFNFSNVERGEKEPLLLEFGTQYSS